MGKQEGSFPHPPPDPHPRYGESRKDSGQMWGSSGPMSRLGVGAVMLAALLLKASSNWVAGLVFPALVPWPRDSRAMLSGSGRI